VTHHRLFAPRLALLPPTRTNSKSNKEVSEPIRKFRKISTTKEAEVAGVTFSDSNSAPVPKFLNPDPVRLLFKFENPTPVQTPAAIINPAVIYSCFYLRNHRTDSCYCRNGKMTPDPGPVFHKFLTPGPKEKRRILPESTPVIRIRSHLWKEGRTRNVEGTKKWRYTTLFFFRGKWFQID